MNDKMGIGYDEMVAFAKQRLEGRCVSDISKRCGCVYDEEKGSLTVSSLGKNVTLFLPDFTYDENISLWQYTVILHYLDLGDGVFEEGQWMPFGDMKDGLIRGVKYDKSSAAELSEVFKGKIETEIKKTVESCGGEIITSKADISAVIPLLPRFPLLLNIWLEDDEFPLSAKMLVSKSADHYLTIEDAVTAGDVVIEALKFASA